MEGKRYYELYHEYELHLEDGVSDVLKFIGIFETEEMANKVVDLLVLKDGFKDYPRECFEISERTISNYNKSGFITWAEASEDEDLEKMDRSNEIQR